MSAWFPGWPLQATILLSALIPLAWLTSSLLRRFGGALPAYAAWLLVLPALIPPSTKLVLPEQVARTTPGPVLDSVTATLNGPGLSLLTVIWITGVLFMFCRAGSRQLRWSWLIRRLDTPLDADRLACIRRHGLPRWVPVTTVPDQVSPALLGCFPPRLVLPRGLLADPGLTLVLRHEIRHLRQLDPWWNLLALALRCMFWFHPLVHLAWHRFRRDQELAVDESVLRGTDAGTRRDYARLLYSSAGISLPELSTPLFNHSLLKERIMQITRHTPSTTRKASGLALALGLAATAGVLVAGETPYRDYSQMLEPVNVVRPYYPKAAADEGIEGRVRLLATIDAQGEVSVAEVLVSEPPGVFDDVAIHAMEQWRFRWLETAQPRDLQVEQVIDFRLDGTGGIEMTSRD